MAKRKKKVQQFYESLHFVPLSQGSFTAPENWDGVANIWVDWLWANTKLAAKRLVWDTPAIAADSWRLAGKLRRALINRWTALILTIALIGSASAVGVMGVQAARRIVGQYQSFIASPVTLLNRTARGITLTDRDGHIIYQAYGAATRTNIKLDALPKVMVDATLSAEDPGFYDHQGFSWRGTIRAAYVDIREHGKAQGGSTITQQLIKNSLLTSQKSFERKFQEIVLSMALEKHYSKQQILEMYLNKVYYGQNAYGIESAAQTYFHKPATQLTLAESALLAGIPQAPSNLDPTAFPTAAQARRAEVLGLMRQNGKITAGQEAAANKEPITAFPRVQPVVAPHFVFYVMDILRQKYGEEALENDGMVVKTTIDLGKQQAAQQIVTAQVARLAGHHATNGGLVSLDPATGQVLAMVGSIGYDTPGFGTVNITTSELQPGSSFKPLVYAAAFTGGWNGATIVPDEPMSLVQPDGSLYVPTDYDGKWRGPVTLRRALANSLNIPALHVIEHVGLKAAIDFAKTMGVTTLGDSSQYGESLVLGSGEVRPLDMAAAYGAFATGGQSVTPQPILTITDKYGQAMPQPAAQPKSVVDPKVAAMITDILADNGARTEEFGPNSPLKLSRPAAAKTGTTNDFRDNWTVGYTPQLVTAVWVGNNDHTAMNGVDGISGAAPIWHDYMEQALAGTPVLAFNRPAGLVQVAVCPADGGIANAWDPKQLELFPTESAPTKPCNSQNPNPTDGQPTPIAVTPMQFFSRYVIINGKRFDLPPVPGQ